MEDGQHTHDLPPSGGPGEPDKGANGEAKIGPFLEQRRKEKGLSLEEAEQATKIRKRYLEGLEREDYAMLPDAVYAQGFLKTYANYLGLDGEALSRQLKSRRKPRRERGIDYNAESGFGEPLMSPRGLEGTQERKVPTSAIVTLLVAVLVLAVVIGALYFVGRGVQASRAEGDTPPAAQDAPRQDRRAASDEERAQEDEPAPQDAAAGPSGESHRRAEAPRPVPPDTLQVVVNVEERPSWLLIRADGTPTYEQVARPGFSRTFQAERRLYIKSGDAGAVSVEINGQDVGTLGPAATIVDRTYTLKSAS